MKIGIDIDDTITKTKEGTIRFLNMYNQKYNKNIDIASRNFDFFVKHIEDIQINTKLKPGAREALWELKQMGYEIIIITARGSEIEYPYEKITKEYFQKYDLPYDKMYFGDYEKGDVAFMENIAYFIDDRIYNLDGVSQHGVECLHFVNDMSIKSPYQKFTNWEDIILYLKNRGIHEK